MKSFAKLNIFLKIIGTRGDYHEIVSRFVLFKEFFDEIEFKRAENFAIDSNQNIENNIILKAKSELEKAGFKPELDEFFKSHKIVLKKNIPMGAGLGGGSSNAATFLLMINEELNLKLSREELCKIGAKVGSDVPFFLSGFESANVSGVGEKIVEFSDTIPNIDVFTPDIFCSTPLVYKEFRANFMQNIDLNLTDKIKSIPSTELLQSYKNSQLNDLYAPCFKIYKDMQKYSDKFLSGSGSSVFCVRS
ncbi:4-diphosphocytidyl-2C-methyl-D-erythritol kinase [Campylobacter mucosalis]|uniref:4-(cytidine 5'-diphospho)-2-C-methyl-D-erythritol kinase n=1 Tax=Campylobacter mucosalis TaxID=202 RepID=UPI0004D8A24E|nr:4-(cytidine 5'-diphospho)-2-C-methyl-D-erythritol kinase [Campylobacter mucosalis]KEA45737.1 4-diphosphocytidyl-2C-methyl-D-erythritol kinase [Campylobacter mucosalis]QKF63397.1 4-diphosphocytidyl-2-C-methylerythritol kinase [Campylobacter mucosalis]